jgi:hypothetical protein
VEKPVPSNASVVLPAPGDPMMTIFSIIFGKYTKWKDKRAYFIRIFENIETTNSHSLLHRANLSQKLVQDVHQLLFSLKDGAPVLNEVQHDM